jgi:CDP-diacylglycerol--serine O-phosphatidyltransferase
MRRIRTIAVFPTLLTLGNLVCGFFAIVVAARVEPPLSITPDLAEILADAHNVMISGCLIFLAMIFDALDGYVARLSRTASDFGAELDSLCDLVTFGVAPGFLLLKMCPRFTLLHSQTVWIIAAAFAVCAALRLARFNVENEPDESAHRSFRGLPSPGAAATVAALVIFFNDLAGHIAKGLTSNPWLLGAVGVALPVVTLLCGLLMVSRFRYPHLVNQYVRGRRPFSYLVKLLIILPAALLYPFGTAAVLTLAYVFSGPVGWLWRRVRRSRQHATPA